MARLNYGRRCFPLISPSFGLERNNNVPRNFPAQITEVGFTIGYLQQKLQNKKAASRVEIKSDENEVSLYGNDSNTLTNNYKN